MKWKDRLLSSSIPLEYEIAKILSKYNFPVSFDYSYKRFDSDLEKEFSIDIRAIGSYPFSRTSSIKLDIDILIECKYRNPNVSWLFVKDLNKPDYSNFSIKGVIKVIDEFSEYNSTRHSSVMPLSETCLKGIEINTQNGEVHDIGITHGINQLVYCIPPLLKSNIFSSLVGNLADNHPYIICPILVTTADLRLLNPNFSIDMLTKSKSLDDISKEVPFLRMYSDVYPSFEEHCRNTFKDILDLDTQNRFEYFQKLRKYDLMDLKKNRKIISTPKLFMLELQKGIGNDLFRETLVCNFKHFPRLLKELKQEFISIGRGLKKLHYH